MLATLFILRCHRPAKIHDERALDDLWEVIDDDDTEYADTKLTFTAGDEDDEEGGGGGGQEMEVMTRATSSRLKSRIYTMRNHEGHLQQPVDLPRLKILSHGCMAPQHSQAATTISLIVWLATYSSAYQSLSHLLHGLILLRKRICLGDTRDRIPRQVVGSLVHTTEAYYSRARATC